MSRAYVGNRVQDVDIGEELKKISRVTIVVDSETSYTAGDDTGRVIEKECPWGTQEMANKLLARLSGVSYKPFSAERAMLSPAFEMGDPVTIGGVYSQIIGVDINYDVSGLVDIYAPDLDEIDDEYPAEKTQQSSIDRQLAGLRSSISKTTGQIRLEIQGVEENLTYLELDLEGIEGRVKDAEGNIGALELTATQLQAEIGGKIDGEDAQALIDLSLQELELSISNNKGSTTFTLKGGGAELTSETFDIHVKNVNIEGRVNAEQLNLTGAITFGDLDEDTQLAISDAYTMAMNNQLPSYIKSTYIDQVSIQSPTILAGTFIGNEFNVLAESGGGSFNLYGKFGNYSVKALEIAYATGDAPVVYFGGTIARFNFGAVYYDCDIDMGQHDLTFNAGGTIYSLRELESRITALENK